MTEPYLLRSLKRVHDESERAIREENFKVNNSIVDRFNDILDDFKESYPDENRIQEINEMEGVTVTGRYAATHQGEALDRIQEVKLKTLQIADSLNLNTDDFEEVSQSGEFAVINLNQEQAQEQAQSQTQRITVEQIIEDIEGMMISPDDREELKELVREYENELDSDDPDPSRLREIISRVRDYSDDAARKLIMLATERGFNILVGIL